jgi:hypothetical protein
MFVALGIQHAMHMAPYCHLWPAPLHHIFPHYLINGTISGQKKKLQNTECGFWFPLQLSPETFLNLRIIQRGSRKYILVFAWSTRHYCLILMKIEFSRQIFEKHSNIKFNEDPSGGSRVIPCGQKDGRADMTQRIVEFCNFCERA